MEVKAHTCIVWVKESKITSVQVDLSNFGVMYTTKAGKGKDADTCVDNAREQDLIRFIHIHLSNQVILVAILGATMSQIR